MTIIDIREEQKEEITEIKFDDSGDRITNIPDGDSVGFNDIPLADWENLDNLIKALHKARELWGPKE